MIPEGLSLSQKQELYRFLVQFITPERKKRFEDIIKLRTRHLTLIIEDIYQPHNASAVLRSCDCFGIQDVHIIENKNKYEVNPDVALGSGNWLSLHKYSGQEDNTSLCINTLKKKGYAIIAATPHRNECLLEEYDISAKTAIMFGSEKNGLTEYALNHADGFVKIPMQGFTESLNISVSAAITLYTL
jgi:tRNA (guanosine-2'-O-)-methyltransferase